MTVVRTFEDARSLVSGSVGLVPTMGYLHEGHLRLIEESVHRNETTVVTVFVNPLQFDEPRDLDTYPRDLDRDVTLAIGVGADVIVAPTVEYMYPSGTATAIDVRGVTEAMEGAHRPGHFRGVATVVAKLFAGLRPDQAYFGRKDAQQLAVVGTMARDLSFPVDVVGVPIVREHDGLALSSRNVRLTSEDRVSACTLSAGLFAAADLYDDGCRSAAELIEAVTGAVDGSGAELEYVTLADAATAAPVRRLAGRQFLAVAARVGAVRLIDNITIDFDSGDVDRGSRLEGPSILYGGS